MRTLHSVDSISVVGINPTSIINPNGDSDWILICEHASHIVPDQLDNLGLDEDILKQHIGYDIGAKEMTSFLSKKLNATAIMGNYSRLVIDCNRSLSAKDCIAKVSDGTFIPGNQTLTDTDKILRINHIYQPFHTAIFNLITEKLKTHQMVKIANIHSFTPMLSTAKKSGGSRPWHIGFVYRDPKLSQPLSLAAIKYIRNNSDYVVGDNEPYNGFIHRGFTTAFHAESHELPHCLVEFRQDLIDTPEGVAHWGQLFIDAITDKKSSK